MFRTYLASLLRPTSLLILLLLAILSVALWFFGALIAIAGISPLQSVGVRISIIVGLFVAFFLITFIRHFLARRANAKLINSMLANDELVSMGSDLSSEEIELIRERFEETLKILRDSPIDGHRRRNYMFELPWYIIIGPPGTGKTTILRNSDLDFPLAAEGQTAIQGIGGTRNCDWWIANEAVLIDTAGRYTTQDVNQGIDAAAWGGFLDLLKKNRRRRPVNGVLLAISIADVAMASEEERAKQAETLRLRLRELHRAFNMRIPVYVLFTKCDLIAGFEEFFDDADEAERSQIWGMTFPYDGEQMTFGSLFETNFIDLVGRLERRLPAKLARERNPSHRCRIYSFPHEFGSLATVLRGFVSDVFKVNRYEAQPLLRGIYFTSGTQEGTPFDRLLGAMGRSFSVSPSRQAPMSGQGKAFFINKVLSDVIFAEQNVIGKNTKLERQIAAMYAAGYAAVIALALGLSAYWIYGFNTSLAKIAEANQATDRLETSLRRADQDRSLDALLPALNAARDLQDAVEPASGWSSLTSLIDVDPRPDLAPPARDAYDNILTRYLLPTVTSRLAAKIQLLSTTADANNLLLREQLETYLMLTTAENYDAGKVRRELRGQAESAFLLDSSKREEADQHIQTLLSLLPAPVTTTNDDQTVLAARSRLSDVPQATDIFSRMKIDAERRYRLPAIRIANLLGTGTLRADSAALGGRNIIPGLYTKNGFYNFFVPRLPEYIRSSTGSDWVLGEGNIDNNAYNQVAQSITEAYTREYIEAWRGALNQVRVIDYDNLQRAQLILQELSGPQSPLTKLLTTLRENTELPLPGDSEDPAAAGAELAGAATQQAGLGAVVGAASDAAQRTAIQTAFGDSPWPGTAIREAFLPLTALVGAEVTQGGTLDEVQQLFGDLFGSVSGVATAPQPPAAAFDVVSQRAKNPTADSFTRLRSQAATKPEPVRSMVAFVADRSWQIMMRLSYDHVNTLWQQEVVPVCNSVLSGRYPFSPRSEEEVALEDFADLFKPAGVIDTFFQDNLDPFVNRRGGRFVETPIQNVGLGLSQASLAQFSRAQTIKNAFFGPDGTSTEARFTIEPTFLDPKAGRSTFTLDDEEIVYRHGPVRAKDFVWPSKLDASVARLRVSLLDGTSQTTEFTGTWAMFRLLSASGLSKARGQDQFVFSIVADGARASYRLKAGSVVNPFNLGVTAAFRCPPAL
ncbi:MAG: type VI secretion system membrane subunit TssM [Pseudomonadota bacterium]